MVLLAIFAKINNMETEEIARCVLCREEAPERDPHEHQPTCDACYEMVQRG